MLEFAASEFIYAFFGVLIACLAKAGDNVSDYLAGTEAG